MNDDAVIEAMAQAICDELGKQAAKDCEPHIQWAYLIDDFRNEYFDIARAALAAYRKAQWAGKFAGAIDALQSAEAKLARLREFVGDLAGDGCHYGDNCPPFINTRHGTCLACRCRAALDAGKGE